MRTWAEKLLELEPEHASRFELELGALELEDVEEIAAAGMTEDPNALGALLWRILQELAELREQLDDTRAAVRALSSRIR